jgi:excisionase family DNA binding protein
MPQTRTPKKRLSQPPSATSQVETAEVLTLPEAAAYLRVPEIEVVRLVQQQELPGRSLGNDWRFLKSALQDWLRTPPRQGSWEAVLSVAGSMKDDPYLEKELEEIYRRRGRPMAENGK